MVSQAQIVNSPRNRIYLLVQQPTPSLQRTAATPFEVCRKLILFCIFRRLNIIICTLGTHDPIYPLLRIALYLQMKEDESHAVGLDSAPGGGARRGAGDTT